MQLGHVSKLDAPPTRAGGLALGAAPAGPVSPLPLPHVHPDLWTPLTQARMNYYPLQHQPLPGSEVVPDLETLTACG